MSNEDVIEYQRYQRCVAENVFEWGVGIAPDGYLRIREGSQGKTMKCTEIPLADASDAASEIDRRVDEKLSQGYQYVDQAIIKKGRFEGKAHPADETDGVQEPIEPQASTIPPKSTESGLNWEIATPVKSVQLLERLRWAVERLKSKCPAGSVEFDSEAKVCRVLSVRDWEFGYSDAGGISRGGGGRGGGKILPDHGLFPLLIVTFMQRAFPRSFRLSDDAGTLLTPVITPDDAVFKRTGVDLEQLIALGSRLGLCLGRVRLTDTPESARSQAIWF